MTCVHHGFRWPSVLVCFWLSATGSAKPPEHFQATAQDKIVPANAKVALVWSEGEFTEGPAAAADGAILFTDIGNRIMRFDPKTRQTSVFRKESGKANGLMFSPQGRLAACEGAGPGGNRRISLTEADGSVRMLADRYQGKRFNSPNDLAIDRKGRVYFTDPRYVGDEPRELDFEGVFLVDPRGQVRLATRDIEKPNGILVSPDQRAIYVADTNSDPRGAHQLLAFDVQGDGTLAHKRVLFDFGPRRRGIDGMTLDEKGNIYAAGGSGDEAGIYVFDPQGRPLAYLQLPGDPTNCVFSVGPEDSTLYITAAVAPGKPDDPPRYGLYRVRLGIGGYRLYPPGR